MAQFGYKADVVNQRSSPAHHKYSHVASPSYTSPDMNASPSYTSPDMNDVRRKMSPDGLVCMARCGLTFTVVMITVVIYTALAITHPYMQAQNRFSFLHDLFLLFCVFGIVANLVLMKLTAWRNMYCTKAVNPQSKAVLPDVTWHQCIDCDEYVPPRTHHCVLCGGCVLKRDHHCFFTGCCVGFYNQRYFVVFCSFIGIAGTYCAYSMLCYFTENVGLVWSDYLVPWTFIRWGIWGDITLQEIGYSCLLIVTVTSAIGAGGLAVFQFYLIVRGLTMHEQQSNTRPFKVSVLQSFRSVFGSYWPLHFIIPLPFIQAHGNGITWTSANKFI